MKKLLIALAAISLLGLASCGGKNCRCYERVNDRWTGPTTTYASEGTRCNSLNNNYRLCIEMDEPIINPDDIGVDYKKK